MKSSNVCDTDAVVSARYSAKFLSLFPDEIFCGSEIHLTAAVAAPIWDRKP
jgi:hypothetical protein